MPELSRRRALGGAAALAATATTATAVAAPSATAAGRPHPDGAAHGDRPHGSPEPFDEVYRGRRIQGGPAAGSGHHHGDGYAAFVDGVELHVMRNADGSWISVVGHYAPVPTPRDAARAAVDELQGARLIPFPAG
ncbi:tyrosinase cofactor [Streptomyces sp. NPDC006975]|uniref:apotyrosinase chaperone MelC1 n=1 Tax=Streptomyces sp. NPDC006975 TaxID=3154310 RepID=UPI0034515B92